MAERRRAARQKSFLRGLVYVSKDRGALACLIRDLSETGARIIFSDTVTLPDVVDLYIPQRDKTMRARVHWRRNDEIGLDFIEAKQAASVSLPLGDNPTVGDVIKRMAMLEAEIAALRAVLERIDADKTDAGDSAPLSDEAVA